jgi:hypothetical protein
MTFVNESEWDRGVRLLTGMLLLIGAWWFASGLLSHILIVAGFIAVATGISGWCPAYTVFGMSTRKGGARHCPDCEAEQHL